MSSPQSGKSNERVLMTVLPGDDVTSTVISSKISVGSLSTSALPKLGFGLVQSDPPSGGTVGVVRVTRAGHLILREIAPTKPDKKRKTNISNKVLAQSVSNFFVRTPSSRRYTPRSSEAVLGVIESKNAEHYIVNIFGQHPAVLPALAFDGATKRNRPHLNVGHLVYARVVDDGGPDDAADPVLSCAGDGTAGSGTSGFGGSRKDWMTGEGTYGGLVGGAFGRLPIEVATELIWNPRSPVLEALAGIKRPVSSGNEEEESRANMPFEIAVGHNGTIWVNAHTPSEIVLILNAINNSEVLTPQQVHGMVKALTENIMSYKDM